MPNKTLYVNTASFVNLEVSGTLVMVSSSFFPAQLTASWANDAVSSSYAITASFSSVLIIEALYTTQSLYSTQSLFATSSISSSYAITASYALNAVGGASLETGSTYLITASWAESASWTNNVVSSSYAVTASFALNGGGSGTTLTTGSSYPVTSSWAISASWAPTPEISNVESASWASSSIYSIQSTYATSSLYASSASWASSSLTASYGLHFTASSGLVIDTSGSTPVSSFIYLYGHDSSSVDYERLRIEMISGSGANLTLQTSGSGIDDLSLTLSPVGTGSVIVDGKLTATSITSSLYGTSSVAEISTTASYVQYSRPKPITYALTDAAIIQTDGNIADHFRVTLVDNRTLARATASFDGQRLSWEFIQDGVGGRTITLGTGYTTGSDFSVQLNQTASKRDFMTAMASGSSTNATWYVLGFIKGY